jgi:hypothetical protein
VLDKHTLGVLGVLVKRAGKDSIILGTPFSTYSTLLWTGNWAT